MRDRLNNFNQDLEILTASNIIMLTTFSIMYILFRKYLYMTLQKAFSRGLANGCPFFTRVDPRIYSLKVLPCFRRTISGIFLTFFSFSYLFNEDWIFSPSLYCKAYKVVPLNIKLQYMFEFTHYFVSIYFLLADPRSKDFLQMMMHHFLSLLLIVLSYKKNFLRYGVVVMFVHEICDPFLEIGKIFSYFNLEKTKLTFFVLFSVAFFTFRFIIFPTMVVAPLVKYIYMFSLYNVSLVFASLLFVLYVLNFVWMMYIASMWKFYICNGYVGQDERSFLESDK